MNRPSFTAAAFAAALAAFFVSQADACMTFVVGKKISATGRVIVGHNEDDWPPFTVHHGMLPAREWPKGSMLPASTNRPPLKSGLPTTSSRSGCKVDQRANMV